MNLILVAGAHYFKLLYQGLCICKRKGFTCGKWEMVIGGGHHVLLWLERNAGAIYLEARICVILSLN